MATSSTATNFTDDILPDRDHLEGMKEAYKPTWFANLYYGRWQTLRLPWRKTFFRGFDLDGNKYFESYNPLNPAKYRRTVKYVHDGHYTDNNVTPQWMAWLRHTKKDAPTLDELYQEVARIHQTQHNALLVQQRWEEEKLKLAAPQPDQQQPSETKEPSKKPSSDYMEAPGTRNEKGEWQPEAWVSKPVRR